MRPSLSLSTGFSTFATMSKHLNLGEFITVRSFSRAVLVFLTLTSAKNTSGNFDDADDLGFGRGRANPNAKRVTSLRFGEERKLPLSLHQH